MVRWASGVTKHQAARGGRALGRGRRVEGDAERADVMGEDAAQLVVADLADEGAPPPSAATPAMVLAAEPPEDLDRLAHRVVERLRPRPASIRVMAPLARPFSRRKPSSAWAITSTMALPMPSTSIAASFDHLARDHVTGIGLHTASFVALIVPRAEYTCGPPADKAARRGVRANSRYISQKRLATGSGPAFIVFTRALGVFWALSVSPSTHRR